MNLRFEQSFEGDEVVEVVFVGDARFQFAMIDQHGAAGFTLGEFELTNLILHIGDAAAGDLSAKLHLHDVERLLGAQEEIDLARIFALGLFLEVGAGIQQRRIGEIE